jgi:DNA-binding transcriptional MerR regulator
METQAPVRIGELSRRVGVSPDVLRAWERRYKLLRPTRTAAGYRLYTGEDERRVRAMLRLVEAGVAPGQAADAVAADVPDGAAAASLDELEGLRSRLERVLLGFDEAGADALLDGALRRYSTTAVVVDLVLPCLAAIGDRWHRGEATVAQEHFASTLLRDRLFGLARPWNGGHGPLALLACPSGERHDIGLVAFAVALRRAGWRVTLLAADTPAPALVETAARLRPDAVVLGLTMPGPAAELDAAGLPELPLWLGGPAAPLGGDAASGTGILPADPFAAADALARAVA